MSPNALVNYAAKVSVPGVFTKLFEDSLISAAALKEIFKPGAEALGFLYIRHRATVVPLQARARACPTALQLRFTMNFLPADTLF
jgi:hypothetical protein